MAMGFKEQLDAPLPIISKDMGIIHIETPGSYEGSLTIKNNGGGIISGRIMSNSRAITFEPEYFTGNDSVISYHIDMGMYSKGDILKSSAVIMSNGGEHSVDFVVKLVPYAIITKKGDKISGLDEFYEYAMEHPLAARQLFSRHEFLMWLYSSNYEYTDIYEKMSSDPNKERALENFFVFNGYKKRAALKCENCNIEIKLPPFSREIYTDNIIVVKDGWGYAEVSVSGFGYEWLRLEKSRLQTTDFDDTNTAYISFFIDPAKLSGRLNMGSIKVGEETISLTVIKKNYIEATLEKKYLSFKDQSYVLIKNNSGSRLTVDILPADDFIKFESVRYFVNDSAKIPFQVELPAMRSAQLNLLRQPEISTHIIVDTVFNKQSYTKKLEIVLGN